MVGEAGSGRRRVIVLMPGWELLKRNQRRDTLVKGLTMLEAHPLAPGGEVAVGGFQAARLRAVPGSPHGSRPGAPTVVDVIEAYWGDLIRPEPPGNLFGQAVQALGVLRYWAAHRGVRGMFRISRTISTGMAIGAAILLLWQLDLLLVVVQSAAAIEVPDNGGLLERAGLLEPARSAVGLAKGAVGWLELWGLLLIVPLFIRLKVTATSRAIAAFARDYLRNRRDEEGIGLRDAMRFRLAEASRVALAEGYDDVVLVGHSFGTLPVVDLIADLRDPDVLDRVTVVTWGSPIAVMACREPWLAHKVDATGALAGRLPWVDVWSEEDWLCTRVPRAVGAWGDGADLPLTFETTYSERISGRSHMFYFTDPRALAPLVAARG